MPQPDSPLAANDTIKAGVVTASPASSVADEKAKEAKEKAKSKTARARRLSYVQNTEGQIAERAGSQGQAIFPLRLSKGAFCSFETCSSIDWAVCAADPSATSSGSAGRGTQPDRTCFIEEQNNTGQAPFIRLE